MSQLLDEEIRWFSCRGDCELYVQEPPSIYHDSVEQKEVDRIWVHACKENPHLFNGKIFSLLHFDAERIYGTFVEYKYFIASRYLPELQLQPLGVSGIVFSQGSVLIGKRATHLFSRPGLFELCPSGSLDIHAVHNGKVNFREQMDRELVEETSIPPSAVSHYTVLGIAHTRSDGIWDLVLECDLQPHFFENQKGEASRLLEPTHEYSLFLWHDVRKPFSEPAVVPLTQFLLARYRLSEAADMLSGPK